VSIVGYEYAAIEFGENFVGYFLKGGGIENHFCGDACKSGALVRYNPAGIYQGAIAVGNADAIVMINGDLSNAMVCRKSSRRFNINNCVHVRNLEFDILR
jgi:hypothetical protein